MKNYQRLLITTILVVMLLPFASAFGETKQFDKDKPIKGQIDIVNNWGLPFVSTKKADYTITSWTDQCLIDCSGEFLVNVYSTEKIFDSFKAVDKLNKEKNPNIIITINSSESYQEPIYDNNCSNITTTGTNGTITSEQCNPFISSYETKTREIMKPYNYEPVSAGTYKIRIEGKKNAMESIDILPTVQGLELNEWAWWSASWLYKKQINITGESGTATNISRYILVEKVANMKADFSDLRFLNSADTTELNFVIEWYNSTQTGIWLDIPSLTNGVNNFNMYYGNAGASYPNYQIAGYTNFYLFNDSSTSARDYSGGDNNGTWTSAPSYQNSGSFMRTSNSTASMYAMDTGRKVGGVNVSWTVALWLYPVTASLDQVAYSHGGTGVAGNSWTIRTGGTDWLVNTGSGGTQTAFGVNGKWQLVTMTYNGTTEMAYNNNTNFINAVRTASNALSPANMKLAVDSTYGTRKSYSMYDNLIYIEGQAKDINWINANYHNTDSSYVIFGEEQAGIILTTTQVSPINSSNSPSQTIIFNCSATATMDTISNMTLYIWNGGTTTNYTTLTGTSNSTTFTMTKPDGNYNWSCFAGSTSGLTAWASSNYSLTIDSTAPSVSITSPTSGQNFVMPPNNFTLNYTRSDSGVGLGSCWYSLNGGANTTLASCNNATINFATLGNQTIRVYANDTLNNIGQSSLVQFYSKPTFSFCNASMTQKFINFSFYDENSPTTALNATIDSSTWSYWFGNDTFSAQNYSFSNSSLNYNYVFCVNPAWGSINTNMTMLYSSTGGAILPQRQYTNSFSLTNITTNVSLYLLSSSQGQYITFQIINQLRQPIQGVSVIATRVISGVTTIINTQTSDASGGAVMWLQPTGSYTITTQKVGYTDSIFTVNPSQTAYTIQMYPLGSSIANNTNSGTLWSIYPTSGSQLNLSTNYTFGFEINTTLNPVTFFGFIITNSSGDVFANVNSTTNGGNINIFLNTTANEDVWTMTSTWISGNVTNSVTSYYTITSNINSQFSILNFANDVKKFSQAGIFGLTPFGLNMLIFLFMLVTIGIASWKWGLYSPTAISMMIFGEVLVFDALLGMVLLPTPAAQGTLTIITGVAMIALLVKEATSY